LALPIYACAIFGCAFLLFFVQPMIGKMILPRLGGHLSVWNNLMLLVGIAHSAGYIYAYGISFVLPHRAQLALHAVLWAIPFFFLPFGVNDWIPEPEDSVVVALLRLLSPGVLLPIFLFSSSSLLLQKWFTQTNHPSRNDPYFLYSFSNLGGLLSLLMYPSLIEPYLILNTQTWYWTGGYILVFGLILLSAAFVWLARAPTIETPLVRLTILWRLRWVIFRALPGTLLFGVSEYIAEETPAMPLIWLVPLSLYMLSFVLAFMKWPLDWRVWPHRILLVTYPVVLASLIIFLFVPGFDTIGHWCICLAAFFMTALVCNGILSRDRPPTHYLTSYYLWMSVGDIVGGLAFSIYSSGQAMLLGFFG